MPGPFREEAQSYKRQRLLGEVVVESSASTNRTIGTIVLGSALLVVLAATATLPRTETVTGVLSTTKPVIKIVPPRAGAIKHMLVEQGQHVHKGAVLAVVTSDVSLSGDRWAGAESLLELRRQRELLAFSQTQERQVLLEEQGGIQTQIQSSRSDIRSLAKQVAIQQEVVASVRRMFQVFDAVVERGIVSRSDYEARRREVFLAEQRLVQLRQEHSREIHQESQLHLQLRKARLDLSKLEAEGLSRTSVLAQQQLKAGSETEYQMLAPVAGKIGLLQTSPGRIVDAQMPILALVPEGSTYQAELFIPSRAIGFINEGQEVQLMLDAYPYQKHGVYPGTVQSISSTILAPGELDVPLKIEEPTYKVVVKLGEQAGPRKLNPIAFHPGMTLRAFIVRDRRSLVEWILDPLFTITERY
jgi:membrane fusion protein